MISRRLVTGVILCGGHGRRVAGCDKGLVRLGGCPLIKHVARRLAPQVKDIWVSVNRNRGRYEALGLRAVYDRGARFGGPLVALAGTLSRIATPYAAVVPCDDPFVPADLVVRLSRAMRAADICTAAAGDQLFPLHAVMKTRLRHKLMQDINDGARGVQWWLQLQRQSRVVFHKGALINLNSHADIRACLAKVRNRRVVPPIGAYRRRDLQSVR